MTGINGTLRAMIVACAMLLLSGCASETGFEHGIPGSSRPWNSEGFDAATGKFTFAVFSDLNGGERERVFEIAVAQLSLLRPELILNVGDLIVGETDDPAELHA